MARLELAHLVVADIEPTLAFLEAAFPNWRVRGGGQKAWRGKPREWLQFGDDETCIALSSYGESALRDLNGPMPRLADFAFEMPCLERVEAGGAGFGISTPGSLTRHRGSVSYLHGNEIEYGKRL